MATPTPHNNHLARFLLATILKYPTTAPGDTTRRRITIPATTINLMRRYLRLSVELDRNIGLDNPPSETLTFVLQISATGDDGASRLVGNINRIASQGGVLIIPSEQQATEAATTDATEITHAQWKILYDNLSGTRTNVIGSRNMRFHRLEYLSPEERESYRRIMGGPRGEDDGIYGAADLDS